MKLNKKGMTLVELIAVITILSILSTISIVSVSAILTESKVNECESIKDNLIIATKEYLADKRLSLTGGSSGDITVATLISNKYFSSEIVNPFTGVDLLEPGMKYITYVLNADSTVKSVTIDWIDCDNRKFGD